MKSVLQATVAMYMIATNGVDALQVGVGPAQPAPQTVGARFMNHIGRFSPMKHVKNFITKVLRGKRQEQSPEQFEVGQRLDVTALRGPPDAHRQVEQPVQQLPGRQLDLFNEESNSMQFEALHESGNSMSEFYEEVEREGVDPLFQRGGDDDDDDEIRRETSMQINELLTDSSEDDENLKKLKSDYLFFLTQIDSLDKNLNKWQTTFDLRPNPEPERFAEYFDFVGEAEILLRNIHTLLKNKIETNDYEGTTNAYDFALNIIKLVGHYAVLMTKAVGEDTVLDKWGVFYPAHKLNNEFGHDIIRWYNYIQAAIPLQSSNQVSGESNLSGGFPDVYEDQQLKLSQESRPTIIDDPDTRKTTKQNMESVLELRTREVQ